MTHFAPTSRRLAGRALKLMRFAWPGPGLALRVWRLRRSGLFDRDHYLDINPGMHPLQRRFPERHYLTLGEAQGLRPAPTFDPRAYLELNPDVPARPFEHWMRHGRRENRLTERSIDPGAGTERPPPPVPERRRGARHLIVAHVFYPELWTEMAQAIVAAREALSETGGLDVIVTLTERGEESGRLAAEIEALLPGAMVLRLPNRGRDIGPFAHLLRAGALTGYEAVCKIHTKRSPHRQDGDIWRRALIGGLLEPGPLPRRLSAFLASGGPSAWVADGHRLGVRDWGANRKRTLAFLREAGHDGADPESLVFPGGSMYWADAALIEAARRAAPDWFDFEPEGTQLDGTLAHVFERATGYLAAEGGVRTTSEIDALAAARAGSRSA